MRELPSAKTFELASATMLFATKPAGGEAPGAGLRMDRYVRGAPRRPPSWIRRLKALWRRP